MRSNTRPTKAELRSALGRLLEALDRQAIDGRPAKDRYSMNVCDAIDHARTLLPPPPPPPPPSDPADELRS